LASFSTRRREQEAHELARGVAQIEAVVEPEDAVDDIAGDRAFRRQFFAEAGKKLVEHLAAAGEQAVRMTPLRHAFARFAKLRERVALDYRYLIEVIGERARRQQAAHARADDDRMTTEMCHDTGSSSLGICRLWQDTGGRGFGFAWPPVDGFAVRIRSASTPHFSVKT
jgi:hypothetical protein